MTQTSESLYKDVLGYDEGGRQIPLRYRRFEVPSKVTFNDDKKMHFEWVSSKYYAENPEKDLWREFVDLSSCLDDRDQIRDSTPIVKFARRWGPLFRDGHSVEELGVWVKAIRVAEALLRVSSELARLGWGSEADWRILCGWLRIRPESIQRGGRVPDSAALVLRRVLLAGVVNAWFSRAAPPPALVEVSDEGRLAIEHLPGGLGGALAYQFAQLIVQRDNSRRCSACNRLLPRDHKARNGIRRYCETADCKRAARADAARDYRSRRKLIGRKVPPSGS